MPIEWAADELSVVVASQATIPASVYRVVLSTGVRTKIGEVAPAGQAGLLFVRSSAYRDNGRQYAYDYYRRLSAMYLASGVR